MEYQAKDGVQKYGDTDSVPQPQIDTMLEDCQPPDLHSCWVPKLGQDVTKQIPFEAKKILPRSEQDLYIIQKHMLAATGPLCHGRKYPFWRF